jgi:hypothetical protein
MLTNAERSKAERQRMPSGRTSMLELPTNVLLATHPACSERRHHQPCRRPYERKLGDQTAHLRRVLKSYADYYNRFRTHRPLNKDAPVSRSVQRTGVIRSRAILGGLHHHYGRI